MEKEEKQQQLEIYNRQADRIYRIAMMYLKKPSDAEDAVQSVFLKYMEKNIDFYNENVEKAWFITVTRNYCKDIIKSSWKSKVTLGEIPEIPEIPAQNREEGVLKDIILSLPPKYKEVIYLYYYEEYSVRDISAILSRKESTIQTQLATARKKIKQNLEKEGICYE